MAGQSRRSLAHASQPVMQRRDPSRILKNPQGQYLDSFLQCLASIGAVKVMEPAEGGGGGSAREDHARRRRDPPFVGVQTMLRTHNPKYASQRQEIDGLHRDLGSF